MRTIGKALFLRRQRGGHRSTSGTAGEHDLTTRGIGNGGGIKAGQRNDNGLGKALDRGLIRLADVDEHEAPIPQALSNLLRRQIPHQRILLAHFRSPALALI
jgi:hypothetical protein